MANTAMFDSYAQEYSHLSTSISRKISLIPQSTGEKKKLVVQEAEREIEESQSTLQQMELEVRTMPAALRNRVQAQLKTYKSDLSKLRQDLKRASMSTGASQQRDRDELFSGIQNDLEVTSLDQRARLLQSTARLEDSSSRIQESYQTVTRTEELGANILGDLHGQRATIERSRDTLHGADTNITRSRKILSSMMRRVMTNKLILAVIILVLAGMIGLVIYLRWFNNPEPPAK